MFCLFCNSADDTNQGVCPKCMSQIRNNDKLIQVIKEAVKPAPLTTAEAVAKCIDALNMEIARSDEDPESTGYNAEAALCELITDLGYPAIVELYSRVQHY